MELIVCSTRIAAKHSEVLEAITTTAGHRGWWASDCDVGRAVGEHAVYRFDGVEVTLRIDRLDTRGIAMTCISNRKFSDWQGTQLTIRAVPDGERRAVRRPRSRARRCAREAAA
jgi:hypothetical protein